VPEEVAGKDDHRLAVPCSYPDAVALARSVAARMGEMSRAEPTSAEEFRVLTWQTARLTTRVVLSVSVTEVEARESMVSVKALPDGASSTTAGTVACSVFLDAVRAAARQDLHPTDAEMRGGVLPVQGRTAQASEAQERQDELARLSGSGSVAVRGARGPRQHKHAQASCTIVTRLDREAVVALSEKAALQAQSWQLSMFRSAVTSARVVYVVRTRIGGVGKRGERMTCYVDLETMGDKTRLRTSIGRYTLQRSWPFPWQMVAWSVYQRFMLILATLVKEADPSAMTTIVEVEEAGSGVAGSV